MSPKLIPVDFSRQILPGSFEHALCHLIDHEMELSEFDHWFCNDEGGAPAYALAWGLAAEGAALGGFVHVRETLATLAAVTTARSG